MFSETMEVVWSDIRFSYETEAIFIGEVENLDVMTHLITWGVGNVIC